MLASRAEAPREPTLHFAAALGGFAIRPTEVRVSSPPELILPA